MSDMKRYQRRLIPVNIVVMVLSLVSIISIMFLPLIDIDLSKNPKVIMDIINESAGDSDSDGGDSASDDYADYLSDYMAQAMIGVKIKMTTMDFANLAFEADLVPSISREFAKILANGGEMLVKNMFVQMIPTVEGVDTGSLDAEFLYSSIMNLSTSADTDTAIRAIADRVADQCGVFGENRDSYVQSVEREIKNVYNSTMEYTNKFTVESIVCTYMSQNGDDGEDSTRPHGKTYEEFIYSMLSTTGAGEELGMMLKILGMYIFIVMVFSALMWFILLLFAFFHTFAKNKRFTMWYVKLWGFTPCMMFGVTPLLGSALVTAAAGSTYGALFGLITSLTWISGGCYIALWLVSIFWAFPIKRRIRKLKKAGYSYYD